MYTHIHSMPPDPSPIHLADCFFFCGSLDSLTLFYLGWVERYAHPRRRRWNRNPRPQLERFSKLVFVI